ncbi:olfactory receptor 10X1-like [Tiliqua scincoides]|uniref:olfactory receptor 10X1-like n=1 Tax=Tiliqua scincoides TaxID=71010 RepID=UPI003461E940
MKRNQTHVTEFILIGFSMFPDLQPFLFVTFFILYILTLMGNALIMTVIGLDRSLHVPMYIFLFALSVSETFYSFAIVPKMLVDLVSVSKIISFAGCAAQMIFFLGLGGTNCLILTFMGYDRFLAICYPLRYSILMNVRVIVWLVAISWVGGFLISLTEAAVVFSVPYCSSNTVNHFFCHMRTVVKLACSDDNTAQVIISVIPTVGLAGSFLFIMLTYAFILSTILSTPSTESRQKAFSTCAAHLTVVIVHYGFSAIVYFKSNTKDSLDNDALVSLPYTIITPFLSPIIFTLRNKDIKIAVRKRVSQKFFPQ